MCTPLTTVAFSKRIERPQLRIARTEIHRMTKGRCHPGIIQHSLTLHLFLPDLSEGATTFSYATTNLVGFKYQNSAAPTRTTSSHILSLTSSEC